METTILARDIAKDEVIERNRVLIDDRGLMYVVIIRYKPREDGQRRYILAYINPPRCETCMFVEALISSDSGWKITPYELNMDFYEMLVRQFAAAVECGFIPIDIDAIDDTDIA